MKIQIRKSPPSTKTGPVRIREKHIYNCKECGNKYYAYHYFCPQCLGEVAPASRHAAILQVTSCGIEKDAAADLLRKLSENQIFDFEKALNNLPWIIMLNSDPAILKHWKECLEAQKIRAEILTAAPPQKKQKRKPAPPLFASDAPFPHFFSATLTVALRNTARAVPLAKTRLRWAETVLLAFKILEGLYKNQAGRILFYDLIFQMEEQFNDFMNSLGSSRFNDADFIRRTEKLKASFEQMEIEIQEVRQRVEERL